MANHHAPFELLVDDVSDKDPDQATYRFWSETENDWVQLTPTLTHQPEGLTSAALKAGIKYPDTFDIGVVRLPSRGPAAGIFTKNRCASPAVHIDRQHLADGHAQGLIVLSKNANLFTPTDHADALAVMEAVSAKTGIALSDTLISCTGVIGVQLPMPRIQDALQQLPSALRPGLIDEVSEAILTTDKRSKVCSVRFGDVVLCGMAKGAGMIEPNMATMLVYFFTNLNLPSELLGQILKETSDRTFNSISVDTDTSTSDSVIVFSTGTVEPTDALIEDFRRALHACSAKLSRDIVYQAEGASKLIETTITGARTAEHARQVAKLVINSPLVKTAVFGADPNWGRVVMAIGKPGQAVESTLDPTRLSISIEGYVLYESGRAIDLKLAQVSDAIKRNKKVWI
jgi:glutamate N-acetyltransferase/amino-acid N-acetyltransferase